MQAISDEKSPMRIIIAILLLCLSTGALAESRKVEILIPPASLAEWYKPVAKRHIWLHNMFKLRREIQAIEEYVELKDQPHLKKWTLSFIKHYQKIGEMVPEWKDELDHKQAERLSKAAKIGDFSAAARAARKIGQSCRGCHEDYRAVVAALYRAPDFGKQSIKISGGSGPDSEQEYRKYMKTVMRDMNRMKIAVEDERTNAALAALEKLNQGIGNIAKDCVSCHKQPQISENYLNATLIARLEKLKTAISSGDKLESGMTLGEVAVSACARCHGSHRMLYDLRQLLR